MGCGCYKGRRAARETDTRVLTIPTTSGTGQTRTIAPSHNWVEVMVDFDGHTTGGVQVYRLESDPDTCVTIKALAAEISSSADNGSTVLHVPPGARLIFASDAAGGGGSHIVTALLTSWAEQ